MLTFESLPLRTKRLLIRPLREGDAAGLFRIFSDTEIARYGSSLPWTSIDQAHAMIQREEALLREAHQLRLVIEVLDDQSLIGTCTLFSIDDLSRRAEVGYSLLPTYWGKGYMNETLTSLLDYCFRILNLNRLEADIDPKNVASGKVLQRLGFSLEGHLRERWIVAGQTSDSVIYGLLQREWANSRAA